MQSQYEVYQKYAKWCRSVGVEPASEETWSKLRDRSPWPERKPEPEVVDCVDYMNSNEYDRLVEGFRIINAAHDAMDDED